MDPRITNLRRSLRHRSHRSDPRIFYRIEGTDCRIAFPYSAWRHRKGDFINVLGFEAKIVAEAGTFFSGCIENVFPPSWFVDLQVEEVTS